MLHGWIRDVPIVGTIVGTILGAAIGSTVLRSHFYCALYYSYSTSRVSAIHGECSDDEKGRVSCY